MSVVKATCPKCGAALTIPDSAAGKKGRCNACGEILHIDELLAQGTVSGKDVLTWLTEDEQTTVQREKAPPARKSAPGEPQRATVKTKPPGKSRRKKSQAVEPQVGPGDTQVLRARFKVRLDHVDEMGAFFLFDSRLLYSEDFRGSFPQKCVLCGGRESLSIYLIDWSGKQSGMAASSKTDYHMPPVVELDRLHGISGGELLAVLGRNELLSEPYCLPFPYYVCRSCSPVGALVTDVRPAPGGETQICEIGIASLEQAYEFAKATSPPDSDAPKNIRKEARERKDQAWRLLPLAVRNRIGQWYKLLEGEIFVAYIPDADFAKAEAGMAGVVVTNRRLVYRKSLAVVEMPFTDNIKIKPKIIDDQIKLSITSDQARAVNLSANESSAAQLQTLVQQYSRK